MTFPSVTFDTTSAITWRSSRPPSPGWPSVVIAPHTRPSATAVPTTAPQWPFYVTAALIPSSHLLYAYIWFRPKKFKAACKKAPLKWLGKHAVAVFSKFVLGLKLFQQAALLGFVSSYSLDGAKKLLYAQTPTTLGIALFLLAAGQVCHRLHASTP